MAEEAEARRLARRRIAARRGVRRAGVTFAGIAVLLIVIWAVSGSGFFWPVFPIAGMGLALGLQAWRAYGQKPISGAEVEREIQRGD